MTQRTLTLRYVICKTVTVDVADDVLTESEIERIAQLESEQNDFDDCNDVDWEWDVKPRPIIDLHGKRFRFVNTVEIGDSHGLIPEGTQFDWQGDISSRQSVLGMAIYVDNEDVEVVR